MRFRIIVLIAWIAVAALLTLGSVYAGDGVGGGGVHGIISLLPLGDGVGGGGVHGIISLLPL